MCKGCKNLLRSQFLLAILKKDSRKENESMECSVQVIQAPDDLTFMKLTHGYKEELTTKQECFQDSNIKIIPQIS